MTRIAPLAWLVVALTVAAPVPAAGQLLSPGKLTEVHADLDGIRSCTECHELRQRGISEALCLSCHAPLAARIEAGDGYHGRLDDTACGRCHKEHLGRGFDIRRFDESSFDHAETGYRLRGKHAGVECRACHEAGKVEDPGVRAFEAKHDALSRTFLGLSETCESCHQGDSKHRDQFADRSCSECHDEESWKEAPGFDHRDASFRLDGRHVGVKCAACHRSEGGVTRYRPLAFEDCGSCHEDKHEGRMKASCSSCHSTSGWKRVRASAMREGFDHDVTRFALRGAHAHATCEACHRRGSPTTTETVAIRYRAGTEAFAYPRPLFDRCSSCHVEYHAGSFEDRVDGAACADCHTEDAWSPSTFGIEKHDEVPEFALTGAHRATPCTECHQASSVDPDRPEFRIADRSCSGCHLAESPHQGRFKSVACDACHDTKTFEIKKFEHEAPSLASLVEACSSCHEKDDPHQGQFEGSECGSCHRTSTFPIKDFDHGVARFSLDGAHARLPCDACHVTETLETGVSFTRYRPLGVKCVDCHGGGP